MSCKVETTERFDKDTKRLVKKYRRLGHDLAELVALLEKNPMAGQGLGSSIYKIRMASSDMQKGKRGGFRIIYLYKPEESMAYLLTIYAKAKTPVWPLLEQQWPNWRGSIPMRQELYEPDSRW